LGIDRDQAECLAEQLTEAIEDGSISEEQAFSVFFDYLSECDLTLEDLGGG
jgi:hypothetical protein